MTFGPTKERIFKKKINKKMRRGALLMVLSGKAKSDLLVLLDNLEIEKPKTKLMADFMKKLPSKGKSALLILPRPDKNVVIAARNLPDVETSQARDLNALKLLQFKYLIITKETIKAIKETFVK